MSDSDVKQTLLILVGGFLGAGKTTLLQHAAVYFMNQGRRVGLITNDQAPDLVDTAILQRAGFSVEEIAGGCFCCRFGDLIDASNRLEAAGAEVVIGEPVGSCTDISATVLQPIKHLFAAQYRLAPFTVLVDPIRLREVLDPRARSSLHPSARYILKKQLEEADLIAINKTDLLDSADLADLQSHTREVFSNKPQIALSALTGSGLVAWLNQIAPAGSAGGSIAEVDYDLYAEGEAVLGWLNATATLHADEPVDWKSWLGRLLRAIRTELARRQGKIVHVKALLSAVSGSLTTSLTSDAGAFAILGSLTGSPRDVNLVLNARIEMTPQDLADAVTAALRDVAGPPLSWQISALQCLSPGRPQPTHRYARVVERTN
jgi:G3E family GTPase